VRSACPPQRDADIPGLFGICCLEGPRRYIQGQECGESCRIGLTPRALLGSVPHLIQSDGRDPDDHIFNEGPQQSIANRAWPAVDRRNNRVRIKTNHSSKNARWGGIGGCLGRPSDKKSAPLNRSISAKIASMSLMSRSIGSNSTPRPTRRTRTSVPGIRNSLGNRTAWLRPCLKILAIPVSDMDLSIDIYH